MKKKVEKVEFEGGSQRASRKPGYHMIPFVGLDRVAKRFDLGAEKYSEDNWTESCSDRKTAKAFANDTFNHMMEHAFKMSNSIEPEDDHLGAIGWAMTVLAWIEDVHGCAWTEL